MYFPITRLRRLRANPTLRRMVRETTLTTSDMIYPLFIVEGKSVREEVSSMPGVFRVSVDNLGPEIEELEQLDIPGVILFGIPQEKDEAASGAYAEDGIVQQAVRAIKGMNKEILVTTDVCLCEYTSHGHCGITREGEVMNDVTVELLAKTATSHAEAGADIVAPSDMMDGRVAAIRSQLDESGFEDVPIMAYSAKYASAYYGPFREAAESTPAFGDRRSYQMDPGNARESIREVELDLEEGADIVMVKPALAYLDIIARIRDLVTVPVAAYNVSGEYAMVKAAARNGWVDEKNVVLETLQSMKRAGADIILTYHAKDAARWLKSN